jgi:hypothetical protein
VRHHNPCPSRSGSCATTPAVSRSSSQRCTLLRCARTNRARSSRSRGTAPQPITGANPTTSCSIDVANRAERCAWPSRNKYRLTAYARVSRRSSPGVRQPRSRRALLSSALTRSLPGSAGSGSVAGRYQRRDDPRARTAVAWPSGTANARKRRGSKQQCARERTLAAQLKPTDAAGARMRSAHDEATPQQGVGDPSATRLQFGVTAYVSATRSSGAEWPEGRRRRPGAYPVFFVLRGDVSVDRGMRSPRPGPAGSRKRQWASPTRA